MVTKICPKYSCLLTALLIFTRGYLKSKFGMIFRTIGNRSKFERSFYVGWDMDVPAISFVKIKLHRYCELNIFIYILSHHTGSEKDASWKPCCPSTMESSNKRSWNPEHGNAGLTFLNLSIVGKSWAWYDVVLHWLLWYRPSTKPSIME